MLPKVFADAFHCRDCGASIPVSETDIVIDREGGFGCQNMKCNNFQQSLLRGIEQPYRCKLFHDEIVVFLLQTRSLSSALPPPSLLGFVPCHDDPHLRWTENANAHHSGLAGHNLTIIGFGGCLGSS